jgi:hypothetical protein
MQNPYDEDLEKAAAVLAGIILTVGIVFGFFAHWLISHF